MPEPTKPVLVYPPGSCIILTSGEYSDYSIESVVISLKEINLPLLVDAFKASRAASLLQAKETAKAEGRYFSDYSYMNKSAFAAWLIIEGYAMGASYSEVHLGSYNELVLDRYD